MDERVESATEVRLSARSVDKHCPPDREEGCCVMINVQKRDLFGLFPQHHDDSVHKLIGLYGIGFVPQ